MNGIELFEGGMELNTTFGLPVLVPLLVVAGVVLVTSPVVVLFVVAPPILGCVIEGKKLMSIDGFDCKSEVGKIEFLLLPN